VLAQSSQHAACPPSPVCLFTCLPCAVCLRACSPVMQRELTYCMEHPEEISKMASVQRKVGRLMVSMHT
jgi:hypothetical protein